MTKLANGQPATNSTSSTTCQIQINQSSTITNGDSANNDSNTVGSNLDHSASIACSSSTSSSSAFLLGNSNQLDNNKHDESDEHTNQIELINGNFIIQFKFFVVVRLEFHLFLIFIFFKLVNMTSNDSNEKIGMRNFELLKVLGTGGLCSFLFIFIKFK